MTEGTITIRARLEKTHLFDSMRRSGFDVGRRWSTYELTAVQYAAFLKDPSIMTEIVRDFGQTKDVATDTPDEGKTIGDQTVKELKAALDSLGVEYPHNVRKDALQDLYEEATAQ